MNRNAELNIDFHTSSNIAVTYEIVKYESHVTKLPRNITSLTQTSFNTISKQGAKGKMDPERDFHETRLLNNSLGT